MKCRSFQVLPRENPKVVADRELEILQDALREHVNALAVDIGPRTPLNSRQFGARC
jgi:hypothetical protein